MVFKQVTTTLFAFTAMLIAGTSFANAMDDEAKVEECGYSIIVKAINENMASEAKVIRQFTADVECAEQEKSVKKMDQILVPMKKRTLFKNAENPYYSENYMFELMKKRDMWAYEEAKKNLVTAEEEQSLPRLQAIIDSLGGASPNIIPLEFYNSLLAKEEAWKKKLKKVKKSDCPLCY